MCAYTCVDKCVCLQTCDLSIVEAHQSDKMFCQDSAQTTNFNRENWTSVSLLSKLKKHQKQPKRTCIITLGDNITGCEGSNRAFNKLCVEMGELVRSGGDSLIHVCTT